MINNEFYKELGERWFTSRGDAVALLRRENETKAPWVADQITAHFGLGKRRVLDVGCGGGFLCRHLALAGHAVTGVDVDERVLAGARFAGAEANPIDWKVGRAERLPFHDGTFEVVCLMDVLEHIEDPGAALREATRVLASEGLFLFHTFNRTWLAWLLAAKGLDWFIKDSQAHVHEWRMFLKPAEVERALNQVGWRVKAWQGIQPCAISALKLLFTRRVPDDFAFRLLRNCSVGYLGVAVAAGVRQEVNLGG